MKPPAPVTNTLLITYHHVAKILLAKFPNRIGYGWESKLTKSDRFSSKQRYVPAFLVQIEITYLAFLNHLLLQT